MAEPTDDYATRSSLLRRVKDPGDQRSWQEFNNLYGKLIFRFAIKAGLTEDEAHEVVQETMIAAAKHLPEFRYDPKVCAFKTWLLNFSAWRVQDQVRKRETPGAAVHREAPEDPDRTSTTERLPDPAGNQLEAIWDQEWRTTLLETALSVVKPQVDATQWQIFDLYALKEWPVREVIQAPGVRPILVYSEAPFSEKETKDANIWRLNAHVRAQRTQSRTLHRPRDWFGPGRLCPQVPGWARFICPRAREHYCRLTGRGEASHELIRDSSRRRLQ
jgi:RNA polymerase sigma-70 factor (ECF subfamily)